MSDCKAETGASNKGLKKNIENQKKVSTIDLKFLKLRI